MLKKFFSLATGLFTRLSAAGITAVMTGAVYFSHLGNGFFMNWSGQQQGEGYEYHLLVAAISLVLVALGGGWASLDGAIARRLDARTATAARPLGDVAALPGRRGKTQEAGAR
jgi:putative oxidoreductase